MKGSGGWTVTLTDSATGAWISFWAPDRAEAERLGMAVEAQSEAHGVVRVVVAESEQRAGARMGSGVGVRGGQFSGGAWGMVPVVVFPRPDETREFGVTG